MSTSHLSQPPSIRMVLAHPDRRAWFPAVLYVIFALADLTFSQIAFRLGVAEGNPFMAWLVAVRLFVPGKLLLTLIVTTLMIIVYTAGKRWRWTVWSGVYLMGALTVFHVWALTRMTNVIAFLPFS